MNFVIKAMLVTALLANQPVHAGEPDAANAEAAPEYVWFEGTDDAKHASLAYGNRESAEDLALAMSCKRRSGTIKLFVAETGEKLRPGKQVTVTFVAGTASEKAKGKVVPNEMAGGTSTETELPAAAPVFAAMTEASGNLNISVADVKVAVPLKGIGTKAANFAATCRK